MRKRREEAGWETKSMNKKLPRIAVGVFVFAFMASLREAQQLPKIPRDRLSNWSGFRSFFVQAFAEGLRDLGYVEGQNITIDYRSADGKRDRVPDLAAELVRLQVDIIVTDGSRARVAAKNATNTIPIVFTSRGDPVAANRLVGLARPGGTSRGTPAFHQYWPANDWSCSRKPFQSFPAWRYCGIQKI